MSDSSTWEQMAPLRRMRLDYWLKAVGSSAPAEQARQWLAQQPAYEALAARWDSLTSEEQGVAAIELEELWRAAAYATRPFCIDCGQCCRNSGPTLYAADRDLPREGVVPVSRLRTVRAGEEVFSLVEGRRVVLQHEHVTVVSGRRGACWFWDSVARACTIHQRRPAQCRAQRCWDTAEADELAATHGLTRLDLLEAEDPVRSMVLEHERQCPPARLRELAGEAKDDLEGQAAAALLELLAEDDRLRRGLVEGGEVTAEELPYLLGRSLEEKLSPLGLEVVYHDDGNTTLCRT